MNDELGWVFIYVFAFGFNDLFVKSISNPKNYTYYIMLLLPSSVSLLLIYAKISN